MGGDRASATTKPELVLEMADAGETPDESAMRIRAFAWQLGSLTCHGIGSSESIRAMTIGDWNRFGDAYSESEPGGRVQPGTMPCPSSNQIT